MAALSFAAMYLLMYAMVNSSANVYANLNQAYMAGMIPHHAGAILMCAEAAPTDPAIRALCRNIDESQRAEITEMKRLLAR
jgi:uncharacterized protein (DUF305 family)